MKNTAKEKEMMQGTETRQSMAAERAALAVGRKITPQCTVKIDPYPIIERAVGDGCSFGWHRAHKHVDNPSEDAIQSAIVDSIMLNLSEIMIFPEGD